MMIGFLATVLLVLLVLHLPVYFFVQRFFGLKEKKQRIFLGLGLLLLSLSFIFAAILVRFFENQFAAIFYFLSGIWMGFLVNLLMAIALAWLAFGILSKLKKQADLKLLGILAFSAAAVFSVFGIWNVFNPQVKNIEVELKNLPVYWKGKNIVQISDLHLGVILRDDFLNDVVEKINNLNPEVVFITGDLFDGMDGDIESLAAKLDNIRAKDGVYYITGNHETYIGVEKSLAALRKTRVKILNDEVAHVDGLQIVGISYPEIGQIKNVRSIIENNPSFVRDEPSVLLYHAPTGINHINGNSRQDIYFGPNMDFSDTAELGIDLQLSGHTHRGQIFPFSILTNFIYRGFDYGLHRFGDFQIYTSSGVGVWGPTMRTGSKSEIVNITLQ